MTKARTLLVDAREDNVLRGFHVLASLSLIADQLRGVTLYRLSNDTPDENIACRAFSFDFGLRLRSRWGLTLLGSKFDLYVSAADRFPDDPASRAARQTSKKTIAAVMFESPTALQSEAVLPVAGHDTALLARVILNELQINPELCGA
jgi:hypothetical protein